VLPPTFTQPERRSYLVPILLALVVLSVASAWIYRETRTTLTVELLTTHVLPTKTVFRSDSIVLGPGETSYNLFIVQTIRVTNGRHRPVSLDDFGLTLTDSTGAELAVKAIERQQIPNAEVSFPKLKALVTAPLLARDAQIPPGKSAEGVLVFSLAVPSDLWDNRKSAVLEIDPYHLDPITLTVPR
jgi:hypothetical protein